MLLLLFCKQNQEFKNLVYTLLIWYICTTMILFILQKEVFPPPHFNMGFSFASWVCRCFFILLLLWFLGCCYCSSSLHPLVIESKAMHQNHTAISEFRLLNRRTLGECPNRSPHLHVNVSSKSNVLGDEEFVTVTVGGVLLPSENDWVAMISPSNSE